MKLTKYVKIKEGRVWIDGLLDDSISHDESANDFKTFAKEVYQAYAIKYPKFYKMDKMSKLGFLSTEILLKDIDLSAYRPEEIGVLFANSSSSLNNDYRYQQSIKEIPSPSVFVYTLPNIVVGEICIRHDFKGESLFLVRESFDYRFFYNYCRYLFMECEQKAIIIGWVEIDMNDQYESFLCLIESSQEAEFTIEDFKNIKNK